MKPANGAHKEVCSLRAGVDYSYTRLRVDISEILIQCVLRAVCSRIGRRLLEARR